MMEKQKKKAGSRGPRYDEDIQDIMKTILDHMSMETSDELSINLPLDPLRFMQQNETESVSRGLKMKHGEHHHYLSITLPIIESEITVLQKLLLYLRNERIIRHDNQYRKEEYESVVGRIQLLNEIMRCRSMMKKSSKSNLEMERLQALKQFQQLFGIGNYQYLDKKPRPLQEFQRPERPASMNTKVNLNAHPVVPQILSSSSVSDKV